MTILARITRNHDQIVAAIKAMFEKRTKSQITRIELIPEEIVGEMHVNLSARVVIEAHNGEEAIADLSLPTVLNYVMEAVVAEGFDRLDHVKFYVLSEGDIKADIYYQLGAQKQ